MEVVEYSSNHKILHSNSVILFDRKADFELKIKTDKNFLFNLKIVFVDSDNDGIARKVDNDTNTITFIMSNPINDEVGPSTLIEVATEDGVPIYLQFVVKRLYRGEYKKIDYTLFEG